MDRNTLLAFFLIALVLLFTPKYMEIFAPQPTTEETSSRENQKENKPDTPPITKSQAPQLKKQNKTNPTNNKHETKTTNIETGLFTAKVSSLNGGSIQGFLLKDFLTTDSLEVNTISRSKKKQLGNRG